MFCSLRANNRRLRSSILLLVAGLLALLSLAGCLVPVHHHGPPPPGRYHRNCRSGCLEWGHREVCDRRCRIWANGICMGWEQRCRPQRVCLRSGTVCH